MALASLQPIPILLAAVVSSVLGALWYSPLMLGPAWLAASGKSADELGAPGPAMGGSILSCVVAAVAMEFLVVATGADSLLAGAGIGAIVGLGIVAMTMLSDSLFSGWGWRLYAIQLGYRATYLLLMGAICGAWPR